MQINIDASHSEIRKFKINIDMAKIKINKTIRNLTQTIGNIQFLKIVEFHSQENRFDAVFDGLND